MADDVLDNPVFQSLMGAHHPLALTEGRVVRYPAGISPFMAVPHDMTADEWDDAARLAGDDPVTLLDAPSTVPSTWVVLRQFTVIQMTGRYVRSRERSLPVRMEFPAPVRLGLADVDDMLQLAARTKPGPFERRTYELGTYIGIRDHGKLIAMAGERMKPEGWSEISAVCTDPAYRSRGLARSLMQALIDSIRDCGQQPFLHVVEGAPAIRLYEAMGFTVRRSVLVSSFQHAY
jgi:predicted GNAT family acetyltransferase